MNTFIKLNSINAYVTSPIVFTAARMEALANHYVFEPLGLTSSTVRILILLRCRGAMNPSEILKQTGGTKSNISQRIRLLEKKKMIKRLNRGLRDKRIIELNISKAGENKLEEIAAQFKKYIPAIEKHFKAKEMEINYKFFNKLNKILDSLEKTKK